MSALMRIQRKRTKGWRMPEGAVYVGRPSRWGNPFTVMNGHRQGWLVWDDRDRMGLAPGYTTSDGFVATFRTREEATADAVKRYRRWIKGAAARCADLAPELAGRDLACWCPLDSPCHADVLLEIANASATVRVWPPAEWCGAVNPQRTHICDQPTGHDGDHSGPEMPTVTIDEGAS